MNVCVCSIEKKKEREQYLLEQVTEQQQGYLVVKYRFEKVQACSSKTVDINYSLKETTD